MNLIFHSLIGLTLLSGVRAAFAADQPSTYAELDSKRINVIAAMLPGAPAGIGKPVSDRTYWTAATTLAMAGNSVAEAEKFLGRAFPAWEDDAYLDFSRTGQRPRGEAMIRERNQWLKPMVLAECVENKGRFLPAISLALEGYLSQPTWTLPAHDADLECFHGTLYTVDLGASTFAADLAEALYLLGDRVDLGLRQRIAAAIERRVLAPVRGSLVTGTGHWWLGSTAHPLANNWNAVCLSGVVGAALTIVPDRGDRAVFAAAGEHYPAYYMNSFHPSGYIDEGGGYWSYGFGRMAILRETLVQGTGGKIELFDAPRIHAAALFGARFQLTDHQVPTFADCRWGSRADASLIGYCNLVLHLQLADAELHPKIDQGSLYAALLKPTPRASSPTDSDESPAETIGVRSYFDDAGVLVSRPSSSQSHMGVAIKAGGNSSHSHNDVGSFVISLGNQMPVGDPGGPFAYDSKTFSDQRYTFKLLNSFGHPVPVVAGRLQLDATKVHPKVLHTQFTDEFDEISIDMAPAYDSPELMNLVRTLRYERGGTGMVTIQDEVRFSRPAAFEEALTTHGATAVVDANHLTFTSGKEHLAVTISAPEGLKLSTEQVTELGAPTFTRIGLSLLKPVNEATVTMSFRQN